MANLYLQGESSFDHNQFVLTDAKITITEDVEGVFDLDMEYPLNDKKGLSGFLIKGNIIKSNIYEWDSRGDQLFEIRKVNYTVKKGERKVIVYAQAIGRSRLGKNFVFGGGDTPLVPAGKTRKEAGQLILNGCLEPHNFYMGNLDTNTNTVINLGLDETTGAIKDYLDIAYMSPLKGFLGEEKSIISAYGGEIIWNNFEVNFVDERGTDNSFIIKSGKNLQELQQEISDLDNDNFATALIMVSADGLHLPDNEVIHSPNAATLGNYYKVITCDDVTAVDGTPEAINVVYAQLRERAAKKFADGIDKLPINNTVNFLQLANTEEFKNYAQLEKCSIGNNVTVEYEKANITATGRVTQIKFNPNLSNGKGKIIEVTIGDRKKKTIIDTITNADVAAIELNNKHNENKAKIKTTKKEVMKYTDDAKDAANKYTDALKVIMEKSDSAIELSITNFKTDSETALKLRDGWIGMIVNQGGFGTFRDQTLTEIKQVVTSGDGFKSEILQNKDSVVEAINDDSGVHSTTLNSDGLSVKNGAFTIYDDSGNVLFRINTNGAVGIKDLDMMNSNLDKFSYFYQTIANMEDLKFQDISCNSIYINGKSLDQYILDVVG